MSEAPGVAVDDPAFGVDAVDEAGVSGDQPIEGNAAFYVAEKSVSSWVFEAGDFEGGAVAEATNGIKEIVVIGAAFGGGLSEFSDCVHANGVAVVLKDAGEGGGSTVAFVALGDHGDGVNVAVSVWVGGYRVSGALGEALLIEGLVLSDFLLAIGEQIDGYEFLARPAQADRSLSYLHCPGPDRPFSSAPMSSARSVRLISAPSSHSGTKACSRARS